ncbi:hypothetical protein ABEG18_03275 [Alsobacter sp. KACC 23698]|uniref:Uncharacterized protein n=1 Tax=Alsobacter sp. KACC 23698 TaxID=3149229 RepID=A0AAU7JIK6_9HYPH
MRYLLIEAHRGDFLFDYNKLAPGLFDPAEIVRLEPGSVRKMLHQKRVCYAWDPRRPRRALVEPSDDRECAEFTLTCLVRHH